MSRRELLAVTVVLASILALSAWGLRGPRPIGRDADPERFSAGRAMDIVGEMLREGLPHPVGSAANALVRERIERRFATLGYDTEVQRQFVCNATPSCATVENILARRPGDPGPYILLVSHYDSVAAGPGASDAGAPVTAILETARALQGPPGVAFLITDGEEAGLLGAEAFVQSGIQNQVAVVVNAENRGTTGPAFLFETSRGNAGLMPAVRRIERPYASSLFYTIYDMLPNDTDASVFKRAGLQVLNFAAIGNVAYYHTPLDSLPNIDQRMLQHHGDNLLSVTRALQRGVFRETTNAVFFDVLGLGVVSWPQRWTLWLAAGSLAMLLVAARKQSWRSVAAGAGLTLAAIMAAALIATAISWLAHLRAGDAQRIAWPHLVIAASWLCGIGATLLVFGFRRGTDWRGLCAGTALVWHAGTIALALTLPGTAYLLLLPAAGFSAGLLLRSRGVATALLPAVPAALLFFPLAMFLYPALGRTSLVPLAVILAMVTTTFAALAGRMLVPAGVVILLAVASAAVTNAFPVFTQSSPRRAPIEHELSEPTVEAVASRDGDVITIRVVSRRDADRVMLEVEGRGEVLRVNGVKPAPPNRGRARRGVITVHGREAVVELRAPPNSVIVATDLEYGLPRDAEHRVTARGANEVASHRGDVTLSRVRLVR